MSRNSFTKKDLQDIQAIRVRFVDLVRKVMLDPRYDTMASVAEHMGWPKGSLSAIFKGDQVPTLLQIKKLAQTCGVTTDEIITGTPPGNKQLKRVRTELEKIISTLPE